MNMLAKSTPYTVRKGLTRDGGQPMSFRRGDSQAGSLIDECT